MLHTSTRVFNEDTACCSSEPSIAAVAMVSEVWNRWIRCRVHPLRVLPKQANHCIDLDTTAYAEDSAEIAAGDRPVLHDAAGYCSRACFESHLNCCFFGTVSCFIGQPCQQEMHSAIADGRQ